MERLVGNRIIRIRLSRGPSIGKILYEIGFLICTKHKVYTLYLAYSLCLKLGIATCHYNESPRMLAHHAVDGLTTLMVGNLSNGTCIYQTYIGFITFFRCAHAHVLKKSAKRRGFREIQFAAKCEICGFLSLEY